MKEDEYKKMDGIELGELVKKKKVKPSELVEVAVKIIDQLNPRLNAVIHKMYDRAMREAENKKNGIFAGVPILLKNIFQECEGEPVTSGCKSLNNYIATRDSNFVKKIRDTGVIFLGYTNVPEFGLMGITEPEVFGPTRNPWNLERTPGGSSGGSASAVASGMVPIAGASDGGGSIRIPAAFCGLFGIKPTRGRTTTGPKFSRIWQGAAVEHILSRSVRDSAAMLDEIGGSASSDAFQVSDKKTGYLKEISGKLPKFKIAYSIKSPIGTTVHEDCKKSVLETVKLLEELGCEVEEKNPPIDGRKLAKSYLTMYFGEVAFAISSLEETIGRKPVMQDVELSTWILGLLGRATSALEFVEAIREWDKAAIVMENFHEKFDLYLTPTTAQPPTKIGELAPTNSENFLMQFVGNFSLDGLLKKAGIVDEIANKNLSRTPFTQLANLTGQPAISAPMYRNSDGLPIGVQFMAAKGREDILFRLAGNLEKTSNWKVNIPRIL